MRPISFRIGCERVRGVAPKKIGNDYYFNVRIFIDAHDRLYLHDVRYVVYELHPSFRNPKQISKNANHDFEINIWTWGFFEIKAKVVFKEGNVEEVNGNIEYYVDDAKELMRADAAKKKKKRKTSGI